MQHINGINILLQNKKKEKQYMYGVRVSNYSHLLKRKKNVDNLNMLNTDFCATYYVSRFMISEFLTNLHTNGMAFP